MPDGLMEIALNVFSALFSLCFLDTGAFLETSHLHSGREGGRSVLWVCVSACVSFQGVLVPHLCVCVSVCVCVCVCVAGWINVTSLADTFLPSRKWVNQVLVSLGKEPSELCGLLRGELLVTV